MSETTRKLIEEFEQKRLLQLHDVGRTENTINDLLAHIGEQPKYAAPGTRENALVSTTIRRGQFYGIGLATAIGQYLETRSRVPATAQEIHEALTTGGFDFKAMGWAEDTEVRSLSMSMSKNTPKFHRLPDGSWGLRDWYPNLAPAKKKVASNNPDEMADEEAK